jgi:hypothetical protein
MKKITRITESDINRLVSKIMVEQNVSSDKKSKINQLISAESKKVQDYYQQHYSKPETVSKFKNKNNINEVKKYIRTIRYRLYPMSESKAFGFVKKNVPGLINLNVNALFVIQGNNVSAKGSLLYDTILHEMAHLIDFKMQELGEKTITSSTGYYNTSNDGKDSYVHSDVETFARVQRLRETLGLNPNANGTDIKRKLIEFIKSKKLIFPKVKISNVNSPTGLLFTPLERTKGNLTELWRFYSPMTINGTRADDIAALFGKYSSYNNGGSVYLNLDTIGKVNISTKGIPTQTNTTPQ